MRRRTTPRDAETARHAGRGRRALRWLAARPRRYLTALAVVLVAVLLIPVPWLHVVSDDPPGTAWRLDGRLHVDGDPIDPPGQWTWLAVGRPQLVGEWLLDQVTGTSAPPADLRTGSVTRRPQLAEPAAAAVGLLHAGRPVELGLLVEVRDPLLEGYPASGQLASVNGIPLTDREAWQQAASGWEAAAGLPTTTEEAAGTADQAGVEAAMAGADPSRVTFRLRDGREFTAPGPGLPYQTVHTLDVAPADLEAGIRFKVLELLPGEWFRDLSVGRSHGMMVALTTYADASGHDLAQGRHIAGTGGIRGDGTVTRVGGVPAKAQAAQRAGADVLLIPASQAHEIDTDALDDIEVVPVSTLEEAIRWLAGDVS